MAYSDIRDKLQNTSKKYSEAEAENNSEKVFWLLTLLSAIPFLSVAVMKYFWFTEIVSVPSTLWESFLEVSSAGVSEAFRLGSLIAAFYEAKRNRTISVAFGVALSISIMLYDMHVGYMFSEPKMLTTYLFSCIIGELLAIRAVFGEAFETSIVKYFSKPEVISIKPEAEAASETEVEVKKPEIKKKKASASRKRTLASKKTVQVSGFSGHFNESQINSKIAQYEAKLKKGIGKAETNQANILKFQKALTEVK